MGTTTTWIENLEIHVPSFPGIYNLVPGGFSLVGGFFSWQVSQEVVLGSQVGLGRFLQEHGSLHPSLEAFGSQV